MIEGAIPSRSRGRRPVVIDVAWTPDHSEPDYRRLLALLFRASEFSIHPEGAEAVAVVSGNHRGQSTGSGLPRPAGMGA